MVRNRRVVCLGGMQYELYPSGGEGDKGRRGDNAGMEDR